jgi:outer membrane receptor protein involved in Fe transport
MGAGLVALTPSVALAQDYTSGNLNGRVETEAGEPVSGATVTLRSGQGQVRTATTGADGSFRITALPAGAYSADVAAPGLNALTNQRVTVAPGGSSFTFTLSTGSVSEVVVTAATRATADFNRTDTGLTVDVQELASRVPVGRSISAVTLLTPGVGVVDPSINAGVRRNQNVVAVSGTSGAESVYYINGLNVTDQRNLLGYADLPFEAIQTIDVKTGGYQAEFGRATGGVINIVSRSGSNEFHFGASAFWTPNFLREDRGLAYGPGGTNSVGQQIYNQLSKSDQNEQTIWASGPILKDHIFFFGLYNPRYTDTWNPATFTNPTTQNGTQVRTKSNDARWFGKLDFVLNPQHRLEVTLFNDRQTTDYSQYNVRRNNLLIGPDPSNPNVANPDGSLLNYSQKSGGFNQIYRYQGVFTDWFTLSALYGKIESDQLDYGAYIERPGISDFGRLGGGSATLGRQAGPFNLAGEDLRTTYRIDGDFYFNLMGDHHVRVGWDKEELKTIARSAYSGGALYTAFAQENCPEGAGPAGCLNVTTFANVGDFQAEQSAYYIQDSWELTQNLTLQLGLRNDIYDYKNAQGRSYVTAEDQWAPRLGFIWDPLGQGRDRVYGSMGDYYLPIATNTSIRASSGEIYTDAYFQTERSGTCVTAGASTCAPLVINAQGFPVIGAQIGATDYLSPPGLPDPRSVAEEGLKPMYEREFILGYEHTFDDALFGGRLDGVKAGVRLIHRKLNSAIEDTQIGDAVYRYCQRNNIVATCNPEGLAPADFASNFLYVLINPGDQARVLIDLQGDARTDLSGNPNPAYNPQVITLTEADMNLPEVERTYKAIEFTFERPFDGRWGLQGSYTYSKSEGNYEGAIKSDVGQTDTSITQDFDHAANQRFADGPLPNDRPHVFKLFGTFKPFDRLTIGANYTASSGRPYGCIGVTPRSIDPLATDSGTPSTWYCPYAPGSTVTGTASGSLATQLNTIPGADRNVYLSAPYGRGKNRLDMQHQVDLNLTFDILNEDSGRGRLQAVVDVFNLFDSDTVTRVVEQGEVRTSATSLGGVKGVRAPYYGRARNYQAPRTVRFGLRYNF